MATSHHIDIIEFSSRINIDWSLW